MTRSFSSGVQLILFVVCLCVTARQTAACDEGSPDTALTADSPEIISDYVQFLEHAPIIDGVLDNHLSNLSIRTFTRVTKQEYDGPTPEVNYRMAYGTNFLYVFIEAEADSLIYRDRAYQMGDGFHMVLAMPRPDNEPTDEFYVLACSAVDKPRME
ncbi:MAG: hypothetical protein ABII79_02170 [bacterium]